MPLFPYALPAMHRLSPLLLSARIARLLDLLEADPSAFFRDQEVRAQAVVRAEGNEGDDLSFIIQPQTHIMLLLLPLMFLPPPSLPPRLPSSFHR